MTRTRSGRCSDPARGARAPRRRPRGRSGARRLLGWPRLRRARGGPRLRGATCRHLRAGAVVVDHGLQQGSARGGRGGRGAVPRDGRSTPSRSSQAEVRSTGAGLEADARRARYDAIEAVADRLGASLVLVGHTRDDQAEQVLLGLSRGSGARSLSGMPVRREGRYVRPLLALPARHDARCLPRATASSRGTTPTTPTPPSAGCARVGCWRRSRASSGRASPRRWPARPTCCARTPTTSRALRSGPGPSCPRRRAIPASTSRRSPRCRARSAPGCGACSPPRPGPPLADVSAAHVESLDALLTSWHGQGPLHVPGRHRRRPHRCARSASAPDAGRPAERLSAVGGAVEWSAPRPHACPRGRASQPAAYGVQSSPRTKRRSLRGPRAHGRRPGQGPAHRGADPERDSPSSPPTSGATTRARTSCSSASSRVPSSSWPTSCAPCPAPRRWTGWRSRPTARARRAPASCASSRTSTPTSPAATCSSSRTSSTPA